MNIVKLGTSALVASLAIGIFFFDMSPVEAQTSPRPIVSEAVRTDTTAPLYEIPALPPLPPVLGEIFVKPLKRLPNREGSSGSIGIDPVLQNSSGGLSVPASGPDSFEGAGNENSVLPPDPVGAIGPDHYVQMVNLSFAIYNRSGALLYGPVDNSTLWQDFGGPCETTNDGDPIVLYDHLADRWLMSQFALPNFPRGPFYQCIAVSQTPDPTGAWYRYEFKINQKKLNDYPKFGVWPDGYYMTVNQFTCNVLFCDWGGQGVVAFERDQMLNGQNARMVYFDLLNVDPNLGGMLPADLDGPPPPSGAPNPFAQVDDNAWGYTSQDQLQIWNFYVDWSNPNNATFTFNDAVPTASFDSNLCGYARNCIPQPGGTDVDAISDRLMYRFQYRNFGDYQTLVVNHTVDADGSDHAGVRWYELRDSGSGWSIYQQGTYAPDAAHRWMGSAAMNGDGDIALGYSVSSTNTSPSIRFTGRLAGDSLGQMTQGEGEIVAGGGYQMHSSGRWGDYSMLSVDPVDDCTFWYTQEYYSAPSLASWQTRIGSFQLADCGSSPPPPTNNPPIATFGFVCTDLSCSFDASGSSDSDGSIVSYAWDFDDENTGSGVQLSHIYASAGTYSVTLTVTDDDSATDSDTQSVTVSSGGSGTPDACDGLTDGVHLTPSSTNQGKTWTAIVDAVNCAGEDLSAFGVATSSWDPNLGGSGCSSTATGVCQATQSDIRKNIGSVQFTLTNDDVSVTTTVSKP